MTQYQKITRTSRTLEFVCLILLVLLPFYLAHHWLLPMNLWIDGMPLDPGNIDKSHWPPSGLKQILGIAVSYVPGLFLALVLINLIKLFRTYSAGNFFSDGTVQLYRRIAVFAFWFVIAGIAAQTAVSVLLSFDGPSPYISLTFTHAHLFAVFGVTVLRLITWIMAVGHELQSENDSFV